MKKIQQWLCGYAFRHTFCHFAKKPRYAQIISGYVPAFSFAFCCYLLENAFKIWMQKKFFLKKVNNQYSQTCLKRQLLEPL